MLAKVDFSTPLQDVAFMGDLDLDNCATGACPIK
jgi:hypothetical protein